MRKDAPVIDLTFCLPQLTPFFTTFITGNMLLLVCETSMTHLKKEEKKRPLLLERLPSNDSLFPLPCISARSMPDAILNKRKPGGNERRETSQIRIDETKKPRYTCDLRTVGGSQWKAQQICMTPITSNPGKFGTNG